MRYLGNKSKLAKELALILTTNLNGNNWYVEPFVGAAGMISNIDYSKRFGSDYNSYIIALMSSLNKVQINSDENLFDGYYINEELYKKVKINQDKYPKHLIGLLAFGCSFGGKFWGGYARGGLTSKGIARCHAQETLRNLENLRHKLDDVKFINKSYLDVHIPKGSVVYCDIPYRNSTKYSNPFNHSEFWEWCREKSKFNFLYVSEYNAPNDFRCIWEKEFKVGIDHKQKEHKKSIERLFIYEG